MKKPNQIDIWLNSVAYEHSQSKATEDQYKRVWKQFSTSINMTANQIIADYENAEQNNISERTIKRKHAQLIQQWIMELSNKGLTNTSIKVMIGAIMSFYKHNDLTLGHIPQARSGITYHNKDITKEEINLIMAQCQIREKAVFAIMAQSGLRPHTIKQLKIKHLENILDENTPTPCKIKIPNELEKGKYGNGHPTFIEHEAIKYTKQYLTTKTNLTPESLLFSSYNNPNNELNTKNMSRSFRETAKKLENTKAITYKIRKGKPSELRLYNLRKYFKKQATPMGEEHVAYLMNHTTRGSSGNYLPQDDEFYRELYKKFASPNLRLETPTAIETDQLREQHKQEMKKRDNEIQEIKNKHNEEMKLAVYAYTIAITPTIEEKRKLIEKLPPEFKKLYEQKLPKWKKIIEKKEQQLKKETTNAVNQMNLETIIKSMLKDDN